MRWIVKPLALVGFGSLLVALAVAEGLSIEEKLLIFGAGCIFTAFFLALVYAD